MLRFLLLGTWLIFEAAMAAKVDEEQFRDVSRDLRCPTCQGMSVLESDAPFSNQIKNAVRQKLEEGKNKQEIKDFFVERYGPWILREPPREGISLIAWFLPALCLLLGPFLIIVIVRKRGQQTATGVRSTQALIDQMQQELAQMRNKG